jgi:hypothetical protein
MKKLLRLLLCLAALAATPGFAQSADKAPAPTAPAPKLTKFNLEFPGGTPLQLAAAIQKALGRPLNVIVADEYANWKLPALKMNAVDMQQLARAMEMASQTREIVATGSGGYTQNSTNYGFRETGGPANDDTVWSFYVSGSSRMPKASRFYFLKPYLDEGLTVDDITSAIQTGWKMRGDATPPALSFHKETKLLIAVGDLGGLDVIEQVLKALEVVKARPSADKAAPEYKLKP